MMKERSAHFIIKAPPRKSNPFNLKSPWVLLLSGLLIKFPIITKATQNHNHFSYLPRSMSVHKLISCEQRTKTIDPSNKICPVLQPASLLVVRCRYFISSPHFYLFIVLRFPLGRISPGRRRPCCCCR